MKDFDEISLPFIICTYLTLQWYSFVYHVINYSGLSNNRTVWNKRTGQGIFTKINKCTGLS